MTAVALRANLAKEALSFPADDRIKALAAVGDRLRQDVRGIQRGAFAANDFIGPEAQAIETMRTRTIEWAEAGGRERLARFNDLCRECNPDGWWEGDAFSKFALSVVLGQLLGSFPTSNIPNTAAFTRALLADVYAEQPLYPEIAETCRRLRRTMKFTPSISEVLSVLAEEKAAWSARYAAADEITIYLPETSS